MSNCLNNKHPVLNTIVSSWREWDPLRNVRVGRATDIHILLPEPALETKVPEEFDIKGKPGMRPQESIDRGNELFDRFSDQLRARDIRVDRPDPVDFSLDFDGIFLQNIE